MVNSPDVETEPQTRRTSWLVGLATIGAVITGLFALFAGLFAFLSAQWEAAGVCLIAAALAFGALTNAVLRQ